MRAFRFFVPYRPMVTVWQRFEMPLPEGAADMPGVIIPRKMVLELGKLLEEAADEIKINLSENKITVAFDHIVLTSKLIDGTFPDCERVVPQGNDKIVEVDPKIFLARLTVYQQFPMESHGL